MYKDHWVPDWTVKNCTECQREFSLVVRKHHCRRCGDVFCSTCCPSSCRAPLNSETAELDNFGVMARICKSCYAEACHRMRSEAYNSRKEDVKEEVKRLRFELQRAEERAEAAERALHTNDHLRDCLEELEGYKAMATAAESDMVALSDDLQGAMQCLSHAAYSGEVLKRKTRADGSQTSWDRRWLTLSSAGVAYYKMDDPQHVFPLNEVVGAAFSLGTSRDGAGENGGGQKGGDQQTIQMIVSNGSRFDFILQRPPDGHSPGSGRKGASKGAEGAGARSCSPEDWLEMYDILKRGLPGQQRSALTRRSGLLRKFPVGQVNARWTLRWFELQAGALAYYESEKHDQPKDTFQLRGAKVHLTSVAGHSPWCLQLQLESGHAYVLEAGGPEELGEWLDALRAASQFRSPDAATAPGLLEGAWDTMRSFVNPVAALGGFAKAAATAVSPATPPPAANGQLTHGHSPGGVRVGEDVQVSSTEGTKAIISGYLLKKPAGMMGRWQRRWFTVRGGLLAYHTSDTAEPIDTFALYGSQIGIAAVDDAQHPWCFYVAPPSKNGRQYVLQAGSEQDMMTWLAALEQYCDVKSDGISDEDNS